MGLGPCLNGGLTVLRGGVFDHALTGWFDHILNVQMGLDFDRCVVLVACVCLFCGDQSVSALSHLLFKQQALMDSLTAPLMVKKLRGSEYAGTAHGSVATLAARI